MALKAITNLRTDAGLTISAAAEMAGVSRDTLSKLEKGKHAPNGATLGKIARALGVTPSEILALEEELSGKASRPSPEQLLEEAGVVTRWLFMPYEDFRAAFRGQTWTEAAQKLVTIAPEVADEYGELLPLLLVDAGDDSGRAGLAAEYVDAWRQAAQRWLRMHGALEELENDETAPDEFRDRARMAREYLRRSDDDFSRELPKPDESKFLKSYV